ncbi:hypothetical protein [Natrinema gari]|uniref:hypothetical protein n=1 Tax=Natrinema gari TaxID=419186 RepID=UPI0006778E93|nr:hypothetical protein [Natrinema gari]
MPEPSTPDGYELPAAVNGWLYDPDDRSNGLVFRSREHDCSVGIFDTLSAVSVRVTDSRVDGFASNIELERREYDRDDRDDALAGALDAAREWMDDTDPSAWSHPDVCEAVFDAPAGYTLETYYLENRESIVYYRRDDADAGTEIDVRGEGPEALTRENAPYLYIHQWNGSGNATVALAPWTEAHGPKTKHPEIKPVLETPEECGLEVALTMAREGVQEHDGRAIDADAAGQAALSRWEA